MTAKESSPPQGGSIRLCLGTCTAIELMGNYWSWGVLRGYYGGIAECSLH